MEPTDCLAQIAQLTFCTISGFSRFGGFKQYKLKADIDIVGVLQLPALCINKTLTLKKDLGFIHCLKWDLEVQI